MFQRMISGGTSMTFLYLGKKSISNIETTNTTLTFTLQKSIKTQYIESGICIKLEFRYVVKYELPNYPILNVESGIESLKIRITVCEQLVGVYTYKTLYYF